MNKIITTHVKCRGLLLPIEHLKENSNLKIIVECEHGQRLVRWNRRHQLCRRCVANKGLYNTSKPGRNITWGEKISQAKRGVKFSDAHKKALSVAHKGVALSKAHVDAQNKNRPKGDKHPNWKNLSNEHRVIRKRISNAINMKLKRRGFAKGKSISKFLPYTVESLVLHIQSKFLPGMTWDNYGEWYIDHIKPDSWFNYSSTDDKEFKDSWALNNLQPLWAVDNIRKSNRFIG